MLAALRLPAFLVGLGFLALGCSDARRTVLQTRPGAPENPGAGGDLVLGECAGKDIDCATDPQVRVSQPGPTIRCEEVVDLGQASLLWNQPLPDIVCASAPCSAAASVENVSPAGITTLGVLQLATGDPWGGWWLAHFSLDGQLQSQRVLETGIGSRLSQDLWFVLAGADAAGDAYVTEFLGGGNYPRDASVVRYGVDRDTRTELATVENISHLWTTVAPDGGFATKIEYFSEDVNGPISNQEKPYDAPKDLDIARFDREGRLLWNQPKLRRALQLTNADIAGFDSFGNLVVLMTQSGILTVARLDKNGNVNWVWEFPNVWSNLQVLPNGGVYILRKPLEQQADGEEKSTVLEYLEPTGRSAWVLELPPSPSDYNLRINASGHALLTTVKPGTSGTLAAHLLTIKHDQYPIGCDSFELPPEVCSFPNGSSTCVPPGLAGGPDETFYFTTLSSIGRIAAP